MSEQQMPVRIWADRLLCCGTRADKADSDDTAYIRADIAERMAVALEAVLSVAQWVSAEQVCALKQVSEALSAFRSATQDTEARHE